MPKEVGVGAKLLIGGSWQWHHLTVVSEFSWRCVRVRQVCLLALAGRKLTSDTDVSVNSQQSPQCLRFSLITCEQPGSCVLTELSQPNQTHDFTFGEPASVLLSSRIKTITNAYFSRHSDRSSPRTRGTELSLKPCCHVQSFPVRWFLLVRRLRRWGSGYLV